MFDFPTANLITFLGVFVFSITFVVGMIFHKLDDGDGYDGDDSRSKTYKDKK